MPCYWLSDQPDVTLYVSPSRGTNAIYVGDQDVDYEALREAREAALVLRGLATQAGLDWTDELPPVPGGWEGGGGDDPVGGSGISNWAFGTNQFWIEPVSLVSNLLNAVLWGTTNGHVYVIESTDAVGGPSNSTWLVEGSLPGRPDAGTGFTLGVALRTNKLFIRARACDECATTTLPLAWQLAYFGLTALPPEGDYDGDGISNLGEFLSGTDPNTIQFLPTTTNQFASASPVPVFLNVIAVVPAAMAVLLDDNTNTAAAVWTNFNPCAFVDLGTTDAWHLVRIGLRGRMDTSQQTWQTVRIKLDLVWPALTVTNPATPLVDRPVIQFQGYCQKQLAGLTYDLSNAAGLITDQPAQVLDRTYNTNTLEYTTNYFQCFDVGLTNGDNTITLRATDYAGHTTVSNFTFTLDYSGKTNPPVATVGWPQDGTRVGSSSFTWRGSIRDPTAQVTAWWVDTNGVTNAVSGRVGRNGDFWIENLPLAGSTNALTLVVTDAVGNSCTTNLSVVRSGVTLTVDSYSLPYEWAAGHVTDPDCAVWVNGVRGTNNGDGTWTASYLHLTVDDTVVQARALPNSDNGGAGSPPAGGCPGEPGNPTSDQATDAETQLVWPEGLVYTRAVHWQYLLDLFAYYPYGEYTWYESRNWDEQAGGSGVCTVTADPVVYPMSPAPGQSEFTWPAGRCPDFPSGVLVCVDPVYGTNTFSVDSPAVWGIGGFDHWFVGELDYSDAGEHTFYHDHGQLTLVAGGAPGEHGLALYGIDASATGWGGAGWTAYNVPLENVHLGGLGRPDTNGFLLVAVEKRAAVDITPIVKGMGWGEVSLMVTPWHLVISNWATMPTNRARSTVGVGEQVTLTLTDGRPYRMDVAQRLIWTTTAGSLSPTWGYQTTLTAPSNAATARVRVHYAAPDGRVTGLSTNFTVIEPTGVDHAEFVEYWPYASTTLAGAGVHFRPFVGPTNVSFYRVQVMEVSQTNTAADGYFTIHTPANHDSDHGADVWINLDYDNHWKDTGGRSYDWPTSSGWPSPWYDSGWSGGSYVWNIPALWRVVGTTNRNPMTGWDQIHQLGANGSMTITKFKRAVSRTIQGVYTNW